MCDEINYRFQKRHSKQTLKFWTNLELYNFICTICTDKKLLHFRF